MANYVQPVFHLPSFFTNDYMSPTEYCNSLTFLPDKIPLDLDAFKEWRGTPWVPTRTPVHPAVARALHYGSTPDFDINFTDTNGPRGPKTKCAVIGSARPKPVNFDTSDITSIKLANTKLTRPKISKLAKLFPPIEPHGQTGTFNLVGESRHTVTVTNTPDPNQTLSKRYTIRFKHPKLAPHGGMSNLRPDDRGMDAATCAKFYRMSTAPEDHIPTIITNSEDNDISKSSKVTFDLGAQCATRSTAERKSKFRAEARAMIDKEAATTKRTATTTKVAPDLEEHFAIKHEEEKAAFPAKANANAREETALAAITTRLTSIYLNIAEPMDTTKDEETEEDNETEIIV